MIVPRYISNHPTFDNKTKIGGIFSYVLISVCLIFLPFINSEKAVNNPTVEGESTELASNNEFVEEEPEVLIEVNGLYEYNLETLSEESLFTVSKIIDGDTLEVTDESGEILKIRLIGIDTPETKDPRSDVECFGTEASEKAIELLVGKNVYLLSDKSQDDKDKYDRYLRYVVREDGHFFNLNMIALGYANEYTYQVPYQFQSKFKEVESNARESSLGLFGVACQCANEKGNEVNRTCIACNEAEIEIKQFDCSTVTQKVNDGACGDLCPKPEPVQQAPGFTCNCAKTCPNMASCAEAYFQLNTCGCSRRDGDNDGIPCESICR